jgi:hypothetical protein
MGIESIVIVRAFAIAEAEHLEFYAGLTRDDAGSR